MLKKLMVTTALTGLVIGAAVAQGTPPAPSAPSPSAAQSSPPATPPAKAPEMSSPAPSSVAADKSSAKFVNSQRSDQFLASKFKGTDVVGNDNEKIGDISDILFDKSGKVEAYVLGVGGFLGIGAKDVALAPSAFQVVPGDKSKNEDDKLKLSMTKDELKQAATFEPYKAPSATTGMGGGPAQRPAPAGGGMAR
jgi:sporulation protein YlmC with PRC-barrel domain